MELTFTEQNDKQYCDALNLFGKEIKDGYFMQLSKLILGNAGNEC